MNEIINKLHLGVYAVVRNTRGELLLIKKSRGPYIGKLDLPGGKMEHGEDVQRALARELEEEVGIRCGEFVFFDTMTATVPFVDNGENISMHHVGLVYNAMVPGETVAELEIQEEDVDGAEWVDPLNVSADLLSPFAKIVVLRLRQDQEK